MQSASPPPPPPSGDAHQRLPLTTSRADLLCDGSDDDFRALVHDLLAFGVRLREIRDLLGSLIGLTGPAYTALISVAHLQRQGEVTVTSVAQHLNVSQPFATAEIGKLVAEGLIDKARSTTDGRSVSLTVTDRAREMLAQLAPDQREINDSLFACLDSERFEMLASIISAMVADADRTLRLAAERTTAFKNEENKSA